MTDRPPPREPAVRDLATRDTALAAEAADTARVVLHDLYSAARPPVTDDPGTVEIADGDRPGTITVTLVHADGRLGGFGVHPVPGDPSDAAITRRVVIADGLQQEFMLHHHTTAPACPGHVHPARPEARDGVVVWRCPTDATRSRPLGSTARP